MLPVRRPECPMPKAIFRSTAAQAKAPARAAMRLGSGKVKSTFVAGSGFQLAGRGQAAADPTAQPGGGDRPGPAPAAAQAQHATQQQHPQLGSQPLLACMPPAHGALEADQAASQPHPVAPFTLSDRAQSPEAPSSAQNVRPEHGSEAAQECPPSAADATCALRSAPPCLVKAALPNCGSSAVNAKRGQDRVDYAAGPRALAAPSAEVTGRTANSAYRAADAPGMSQSRSPADVSNAELAPSRPEGALQEAAQDRLATPGAHAPTPHYLTSAKSPGQKVTVHFKPGPSLSCVPRPKSFQSGHASGGFWGLNVRVV